MRGAIQIPHTDAMDPRRMLSACTSVFVVCLIAFLLQIFIHSPISPVPLELPVASPPSDYTKNALQSVVKIGEGVLQGPEDVCVDKTGAIYTATRDGWIMKIHPNGSWENWKMVGGPYLFGLAMSMDGDLIVAEAYKGLLKVNRDSVTVLASEVEGSKIRCADEVIEASDGSIYFSDASTKFEMHDWFLDVLEAKPHGRILKYDPSMKRTTVLMYGLCFPNGVALSPAEDFLIVCETWRFRCLKYWLKGELEGKRVPFIENLPGAPDNINLAPDGSFWIALLELRSTGLDFVHRSSMAKRILATFPKLMNMITPVKRKATVVNVGPDGKILKMYDDWDGKVMSLVTSALEFEGHLYLGNLGTNFVGKLPLH
ncbi:protein STRICTOSIDINE SYNTHASE-LIKE 4-like isoform X1 [Magnolia sinica]|uniref:protein STRICTOSIDINE SYNTHASE-LIKE 4-like isoform X1 n=1 Tax=Magnolia sinica TaxID=86752 RepID=UPI00265AAFA1|nr:protein STRICTOSIDINE SYNTHASE-LIKE 4-like isoform X1 [Magnolia sinica]